MSDKALHAIKGFAIAALLILSSSIRPVSASGSAPPPTRQVNVPYWAEGAPYPSRSIFWFGQVSLTDNYADMRLIYDKDQLKVTAHVIDRLLRYDTTPSPGDLTQWDSISVYINLDGNTGAAPSTNSYRFDAQVSWHEPQVNYQASYRGTGSSWQLDNTPFSIATGWRGGGVLNDDIEDKGWEANFYIPFSSLGLGSAPAPQQGTTWGLAIMLHDRDDFAQTAALDTYWPETMNANQPSTWGRMRLGMPVYSTPPTLPSGTTVIRHGLNGAMVVDGAVGGHTVCGDFLDHWTEWGNANYAGYDQVNIQNQWDISDYPCFSKFYITFPLDSIPPGQSIVSASYSMYIFGNSGGGIWGEPPKSYIQALSVDGDWEEATLSWNNAPLAVENISGTWVDPMSSPAWVLYTWDVSSALAKAYANGEPLRLAFYSADGEYHTGKYFISSDINDYDAATRPTLTVQWGDMCSSPGVTCTSIHFPLVVIQ